MVDGAFGLGYHPRKDTHQMGQVLELVRYGHPSVIFHQLQAFTKRVCVLPDRTPRIRM